MEPFLLAIQRFFPTLLRMSLSASVLVLVVIAVRFLFRKMPKWIVCLLWVLVAVRLLCPILPKSSISLMPRKAVQESQLQSAMDAGLPAVEFETFEDHGINQASTEDFVQVAHSAAPSQYLPFVWAVGVLGMLTYALFSFLRLRRQVAATVQLSDGVFACDEVQSPFILGMLRPRIYVPSSLQEPQLSDVLAHEHSHLKRRDHWWKPLGFLLLSVYWFNPLCWVAYILLCRDIEMACDERVIRDMDRERIAAYSQTILDCNLPRKRIAACPLAFGEVGIKARVKSILNYKKPAFWILLAAIAACIVLAVCFLTNPNERVRIDREQVEKVTYYNLFIGDACQGELNAAQTDEMVQRFSAITNAKKDHRYEGQTPGYQLCVSLKNGSFLYANGYHATDDMVEIIMNGSRYSISDSDFASYLRNVCSGGDVSPVQQAEQGKFYLTVGADGVKSIQITAPYFSGGCENADGSLYQKGEQVWLEVLDGREDLRGVTFTALDEKGTVLWTASVPDTEDNKGFTRLTQDGWTITNLRGTPAESTGSPTDLETLRAKYPEYFDLGTFKGLELYVWQMAPDSYSCGLMLGTNRNKTLEELMNLKGASIEEMRAILSTYDIAQEDVFIIPCQNPISSYLGEYWIQGENEDDAAYAARQQAYIDGIRQMLFDVEQNGEYDPTDGGVDDPGSVTVDIRADVCALYLEVLEDLWNVDPGLNDGISQIGIDLSELSHLTELEKETVMQEFAAKHHLPFIAGTWEELCEQGYIDQDNLYWEDGLFFSIKTDEDAEWNLPYIKDGDSVPELTAFDAYKWRSGLGAYFFGQCTVQKNADGKWSYSVGQHAIA